MTSRQNRVLNVRIFPDTYARTLGVKRRVSERELQRLITRILLLTKSEVQERTPVGATGHLRGGYAIERPQRIHGGRLRGALVNAILYHDFVEEGRLPGRMPPPQALERWVGSKLGIGEPERSQVAFAIARNIGLTGTEPQWMVRLGWAKTRRRIRPELRKLGLRVARAR